MFSLSTLQDNFFIIHVKNEYDYLYETKKKTVKILNLYKIIII